MSTRSEREGQKALNEKHTQILNEMLARPENKTCADCGAKGLPACSEKHLASVDLPPVLVVVGFCVLHS